MGEEKVPIEDANEEDVEDNININVIGKDEEEKNDLQK